MDVADWLRQLGLERYEAAFREHDVSAAVLPNVTVEDLKSWVLHRSAIGASCWRQSLHCAVIQWPWPIRARSRR